MGYKDTNKIFINKRKEILDEFIRTNKRWKIIEPSEIPEEVFGTKDSELAKKKLQYVARKYNLPIQFSVFCEMIFMARTDM